MHKYLLVHPTAEKDRKIQFEMNFADIITAAKNENLDFVSAFNDKGIKLWIGIGYLKNSLIIPTDEDFKVAVS